MTQDETDIVGFTNVEAGAILAAIFYALTNAKDIDEGTRTMLVRIQLKILDSGIL